MEKTCQARQAARFDTALNELKERAQHVRRMAKAVNKALLSEKRREEEEKSNSGPMPVAPLEYPADTVLGGMEQAGYAIAEACDVLERTLEQVREMVGEAGILF